MGEYQETVEIADEETGEIIPLSSSALVASIRDYLLSKRRLQIQATEWTKLSEGDQKDEIAAITNTAIDLVEAVVDTVAAASRPVIHAKLDNFKIKDGVVTITAKGSADDGALLSLNHVGQKNLKIVVADAEQHDVTRPEIHVPKDEPELPIEGVEESTPAGAETTDEPEGENQEMSDAEIAETEEMMADDDDLQEEVDETPDEQEQDPELPPRAMAERARLRGAGPDENPFDGGTEEYTEWDKGYAAADKQIADIVAQGHAAAEAGEDRSGGKWKEGTDAYNFWIEGYDSWRVEQVEQTDLAPPKEEGDDAAEPKEEASAPAESENLTGSEQSDSYGAGRAAAKEGIPKDQNPHKSGTVAARFWNDGHDAFDAEGVDAG